MIFAFLIVTLLLTFVNAHMKLYYEPTQRPIRNAPDRTSDGKFSVAKLDCGGAPTYGQNGYSTVTRGESMVVHWNYGTGTNGDHKSPDVRFRVALVSLDTQDFKEIKEPENALVSDIDGSQGSRPGGYSTTVKINKICDRCVLAVLDQRNWMGCIDLKSLPPMGVDADALQADGSYLLEDGEGVVKADGTVVCHDGSEPEGDGLNDELSCSSGSAGTVVLVLFLLCVAGSVATLCFLKFKRPETFERRVAAPTRSVVGKVQDKVANRGAGDSTQPLAGNNISSPAYGVQNSGRETDVEAAPPLPRKSKADDLDDIAL